jgi:hypothetical protein
MAGRVALTDRSLLLYLLGILISVMVMIGLMLVVIVEGFLLGPLVVFLPFDALNLGHQIHGLLGEGPNR